MDCSCLGEFTYKWDKKILFLMQFAKTVFPPSFGNPALKSRRKKTIMDVHEHSGGKMQSPVEVNSIYSDIISLR